MLQGSYGTYSGACWRPKPLALMSEVPCPGGQAALAAQETESLKHADASRLGTKLQNALLWDLRITQ